MTKEANAQVLTTLAELSQRVKQHTLHELTDDVYALREIAKLGDEIRKRANKMKETLERVACMGWVATDPDGPIRTEYCTGTPDVKQMASLPHPERDPDDYAALMKFLGVENEDAVRLGAVSLHYTRTADWITEMAGRGEPLPPGIKSEKTYPQYKLTVRGKKEVDADSDN